MSDFYQNVVNKYKGSPAAVVLFILSLAMFGIGANHFVEDTYSSKFGLESLENIYQLNVQIFQWSYWTMSLAPQVASMVFFYMYLADTSKKWCLWVSLLSQLADFFADSWYRSDGNLLESSGVFIISSVLTFVYFSVGSEMFVSVGGGLILKMMAPAIAAWKKESKNIGMATKGQYNEQTKEQGGQGGGGKQKHKGFERREELSKMYHGADRREKRDGLQELERFKMREGNHRDKEDTNPYDA